MRRLVALGLAAAALALPAAGSASAEGTECVPVGNLTGVCAEYSCRDHHCFVRSYDAVYTTCAHPFFVLCKRVVLPNAG